MEALCEALQATVQQWRGRFPSPLPLQLYTSSNFVGLFVEEQVADVLKQFAADFAAEATRKAGEAASFDWLRGVLGAGPRGGPCLREKMRPTAK